MACSSGASGCSCSAAQQLIQPDRESAGLSSVRLERLMRCLRAAIDSSLRFAFTNRDESGSLFQRHRFEGVEEAGGLCRYLWSVGRLLEDVLKDVDAPADLVEPDAYEQI